MEEMKYKVYILLDSKSCITGVESTAFYDEQYLIDEGYVFIEDGCSSELHRHAQPNYLRMKYGKPTYDETMKPNFKYEDRNIIALTDEEKEMFFPTPIPEPTFEEIQNDINIDTDYRLSMLELGF